MQKMIPFLGFQCTVLSYPKQIIMTTHHRLGLSPLLNTTVVSLLSSERHSRIHKTFPHYCCRCRGANTMIHRDFVEVVGAAKTGGTANPMDKAPAVGGAA